MSGEKTEAPTAKRREDVRRRGNVPKSAELTGLLGFLAGVLLLQAMAGQMVDSIGRLMTDAFGSLSVSDWTVNTATRTGWRAGMTYLGLTAPLFATVAAAGIAGNFVQSGFVLTTTPLKPDVSRINALKGFQRLFAKRSLVELIRSLVKLGIVGYLVYQGFRDQYIGLLALSGADLTTTASQIARVAVEILTKTAFALLAISALDYAYRRWEHTREIRMTKQELKEEYRQSEGDPKLRSRIRQQQRKLASRRMMHDVPSADVVITNPTHIAVAIHYRPESMKAPKVVAKGERLIAQKIKEVAAEHGVPVLENKPLAQALFKTAEIGAEIPPMLYRAVAEVMAFIYSIKRERVLGGSVVR